MVNVLYSQNYEKYSIAAIPAGNEIDVRFMMRDQTLSFTIELCKDKRQAVEGAKRFPALYELALKHGYYMQHDEFLHPDGRTVSYSFAMDLHRSVASFEQLLIDGIIANSY